MFHYSFGSRAVTVISKDMTKINQIYEAGDKPDHLNSANILIIAHLIFLSFDK